MRVATEIVNSTVMHTALHTVMHMYTCMHMHTPTQLLAYTVKC